MPPHCDAMDGPVVKEARRALETGKVEFALPFAPEEAEDEIRKAFDLATKAGAQGAEAKEAAEMYFFETVVRLHRAGERAPYTGLKPAGLDHGPVIPLAERAIETGSPAELLRLIADTAADEIKHRLDHVARLQAAAGRGVRESREYTSAMLGFQVWSNKVYTALKTDPHAAHAAYERHAD